MLMNERIKQLAEQAGFDVEDRTNEIWFDEGWYTSIVERFAELVRQDEREACAKACEKVHDDYINDRNNDGYDWPDGHDCADAIRARGNT
jgi:hypothetical protein